MTIPLDKLLERKRNVYELTCAAIKRADQLTILGDKTENSDEIGKIVSIGLTQILTEKVEYKREN
jgi:DNA-directed RNA polymerase subunit omega